MEILRPPDITTIAEHVARAQVRQIASAIRQVMRRLGTACPRIAVLAGQGAFLAQPAAAAAGLSTVDMAEHGGSAMARAAPAAAVAYLLAALADKSEVSGCSRTVTVRLKADSTIPSGAE